LRHWIAGKTARVGVLGLGYVGLPLAVEFARAGFDVTGIDVQQSRTAQFNRGQSYIKDVSDEILKPLIESGKLPATSDLSVIGGLDAIDLCVPTPLAEN
jgi:UDP-N-acetyl-D-glucosamine dehydrogenase